MEGNHLERGGLRGKVGGEAIWRTESFCRLFSAKTPAFPPGTTAGRLWDCHSYLILTEK